MSAAGQAERHSWMGDAAPESDWEPVQRVAPVAPAGELLAAGCAIVLLALLGLTMWFGTVGLGGYLGLLAAVALAVAALHALGEGRVGHRSFTRSSRRAGILAQRRGRG